MQVEYLKPKGMHSNPAFSQALVIPGGARLLVIGGQNSVNDKGEIVFKNDLGKQTTKALENLALCLQAANAGVEHLVKLTIHIAGDHDITSGFEAWMKFAGQQARPPAVTLLKVLALSRPDFMVEIEGWAVLEG